jgi:hypothetical protein
MGSEKPLVVPDPTAGPREASMSTVDEEKELWKQAIDLQKHFNDMIFRIRAFFFGFLGTVVAVRGLAGIHIGGTGAFDPKHPDLPLEHRFLVLALLLAPSLAVYMLDRFYYHPLLVGAVRVAMEIEARRPALRLSATIREENHGHTVLRLVKQGRAKVSLFYCALISSLVGLVLIENLIWSICGVALTSLIFFLAEMLQPSKAATSGVR